MLLEHRFNREHGIRRVYRTYPLCVSRGETSLINAHLRGTNQPIKPSKTVTVPMPTLDAPC